MITIEDRNPGIKPDKGMTNDLVCPANGQRLTDHAHQEPRQAAYEINRRQFQVEQGNNINRSRHNKIKTDSFDNE